MPNLLTYLHLGKNSAVLLFRSVRLITASFTGPIGVRFFAKRKTRLLVTLSYSPFVQVFHIKKKTVSGMPASNKAF